MPEALAFAARNMPDLAVADAQPMAGGFWNDVLRVRTKDGVLVLKHYREVMEGTLFPNLPSDEGRALERLRGLGVAPEPVGFWAAENVLIYHYVEGRPWAGDVAAVARLLRRKRAADPGGFRTVPVMAEAILAQGETLLDACASDDLVASFRRLKPKARDLGPSTIVLIHTDMGATNLIGEGNDLRLIDWQCPAAGDEAEDIASFLSPAFQILNNRAPLSVADREAFFDALEDPGQKARLCALEPAFAWRMAAYCVRRIQTAGEAAVRDTYRRAVAAELRRLEDWR
jgi:thiamine kinase